jgi:hypothetical protein
VPTPPYADQDDVDDLLELLHVERGLRHLRVRRRGGVLTIESGPKDDDAVHHARLRRVTKHLWTLEVATHMGEWQATGLRSPLPELVRNLEQQFPWVLAPRA